MKPSDRIRIISEIASSLDSSEWSLIDLTFRQFGLPWTDEWFGDKTNYIVEMIQGGDDQCLLNLASHLGITYTSNTSKTAFTYSEVKELLQDIDKQKTVIIDVATGGGVVKSGWLRDRSYRE